jgi:hypothetical protein
VASAIEVRVKHFSEQRSSAVLYFWIREHNPGQQLCAKPAAWMTAILAVKDAIEARR